MEKITVTCQISCQLCGWNTGASICVEKDNLVNEILQFLTQCWKQHSSRVTSGKLQISWEPLEAGTS